MNPRPLHTTSKTTIFRPSRLPSWLGWLNRLAPRQPDLPEVRSVKMKGYLLALLAATPGLILVQLELLRELAYMQAVTHGSVMLGAVLLFFYVRARPARISHAERYFAALLGVSAVSFLILYAQQPDAALGYELLGMVLLFIVSGLLLILPPQASFPASLALMLAYALEVIFLSRASQHVGRYQWLTISVLIGIMALLVVGVVVRQTLSTLTGRLSALEELAARDALTGLFNRRGFEQQTRHLREDGQGGVLLVIDIDDFKRINDTVGHLAGDRLLTELAQVLAGNVPPGGVVGRWGGEEFIVYLHGLTPPGANALAEDLRLAVAQGALNPPLTVSLGLSRWDAQEDLLPAFRRADQAMYAAKGSGKNRVRQAERH